MLLTLHGVEELGVGLGLLHAVGKEFHPADFVHGVQHLAQDPHFLQLVLADLPFFTAGAGALDVHGLEHTHLGAETLRSGCGSLLPVPLNFS